MESVDIILMGFFRCDNIEFNIIVGMFVKWVFCFLLFLVIEVCCSFVDDFNVLIEFFVVLFMVFNLV